MIFVLLLVIVAAFFVLTYQSEASSRKIMDRLAAIIMKVFLPEVKPGMENYPLTHEVTQHYLRKLAHVFIFAVMTVLFLYVFSSAACVFVMLAVLAVGSELMKGITGHGRHTEYVDMVLNAIGIIIGWLVWL